MTPRRPIHLLALTGAALLLVGAACPTHDRPEPRWGDVLFLFGLPQLAAASNRTLARSATDAPQRVASFTVKTDWPTPRFVPKGTGFNSHDWVAEEIAPQYELTAHDSSKSGR